MRVLVDTSVWSLAFRRRTADAPEARRLRQLIRRGEAVLIGPIRQEILSGIHVSEQFFRLREQLRSFPDHSLDTVHFERAAEMSNICRTRGIQASATDFLICAVAELDQMTIFTTDRDFGRFAQHLRIKLLK